MEKCAVHLAPFPLRSVAWILLGAHGGCEYKFGDKPAVIAGKASYDHYWSYEITAGYNQIQVPPQILSCHRAARLTAIALTELPVQQTQRLRSLTCLLDLQSLTCLLAWLQVPVAGPLPQETVKIRWCESGDDPDHKEEDNDGDLTSDAPCGR
jgi:hypothetical protein